ncbi:MAG: Cytoskeleton protein RodZ [Verrucomicrobia subdivision 3 bacterium]|nr:Cytoskeleton protein RodZ [Limisphaerales bacterium]MCS1417133.1 Cytoskeleton protein RodZ [Limisphaerales bacterium]
MPTVAEQLRIAREQQQLSVEDVAEMTKLRYDHVRALETGDYNVFSAPVYVRGFTRIYAKILKLDAPKLLEALRQELASENTSAAEDSYGPHSKGVVEILALYLSRINWKVVLPILLLFSLLAIGSLGMRLWQHQQSRDPLTDLGDGIYSSERTLPTEHLPLPPPSNLTNSP